MKVTDMKKGSFYMREGKYKAEIEPLVLNNMTFS